MNVGMFIIAMLTIGAIGVVLGLRVAKCEVEILKYIGEIPVMMEEINRARDEIIYNLEEIRRLDGTIMTRIIELQNESFAALVDMHQSSMDRLMAKNLTEYEFLKGKGLVNSGGRIARRSDNIKRKLEREGMDRDGYQENESEADQND